jgi:hypothetical protein
MWTKLNETMLKHKFPKPNFEGFMVDSAQANWNMVRIVYGLGDPSIRMVDKSVRIYSIELNHLINTPNKLSDMSCKMNTRLFATNIRMHVPWHYKKARFI